jgi:hypothetical protein
MEQPHTLIRTRATLNIMKELSNMDILPEAGQRNLLGFITKLQKEILAFLLQKQLNKK